MKNEHINECPVCKCEVEEDEDHAASHNCNGTFYDLCCPNCGAKTTWYFKSYEKTPYPYDLKNWKIPKIAKEKYLDLPTE